MEHLKLATALGNRIEEARAYSNLGSSHHYKRNFEQVLKPSYSYILYAN